MLENQKFILTSIYSSVNLHYFIFLFSVWSVKISSILTRGKIISPWLGDKVDSGIVLAFRSTSPYFRGALVRVHVLLLSRFWSRHKVRLYSGIGSHMLFLFEYSLIILKFQEKSLVFLTFGWNGNGSGMPIRPDLLKSATLHRVGNVITNPRHCT